MFINKIQLALLLSIAVLCFSSCNKWLDVQPQNGLISDEYWQTKEQVKASVTGCYASLLSDGVTQSMFLWGELRGDMISPTINASIDERNIATADILPSNSITSWEAIYKTVNYCNVVIDFAPGVLKRDPTFKQADLDAYLGEARGIRALMYFYLLRTFGEVPLQLKATSSDDDLNQLPKSNKEEIYKQIVEDLNFAVKTVKLTTGNSSMDKGHLTKYAIYALQADVYLWGERYEDCLAACENVINSKQFVLYPALSKAEFYNAVFFNGNSVESILELQFDRQKLNPFFMMLADGRRRFLASEKVMQKVFPPDPIDPTLNDDYRGDGVSIRGADQMIWKFSGTSANGNVRARADSYAHWFLYRYSDILLMKAEALAWLNKGGDALRLVDDVRLRAKAISETAQSPDSTDAQAVTNYIMEERSREFAFEGKRWFDMLRNAKRKNYSNLEWLLDIIAEVAPGDKQQAILNKFRDVRSHYLPINQREINADKNLVQNPYYQ